MDRLSRVHENKFGQPTENKVEGETEKVEGETEKIEGETVKVEGESVKEPENKP